MWIVEWIQNNPWVAAAIGYAFVSAIVAATETKRDDAALRRFIERFVLLKPKNVFGTLHVPGTNPGPIVEPPDDDDAKPPTSGSAAGLGMSALLLTFSLGCGAVAADVVTPTYELTVEACHQRELAIVAREGTTREEDEIALAKIRAKCDRAFDGIEAAGELLDVVIEREAEEAADEEGESDDRSGYPNS
ncbi:MAG: hypothetical protein AAGD14_12680 [Planctomycetota bacterium]